MSRLKADLRVTQQEKETLQQEVVALRKQLQNGSEKVMGFRRLEAALLEPAAGASCFP